MADRVSRVASVPSVLRDTVLLGAPRVGPDPGSDASAGARPSLHDPHRPPDPRAGEHVLLPASTELPPVQELFTHPYHDDGGAFEHRPGHAVESQCRYELRARGPDVGQRGPPSVPRLDQEPSCVPTGIQAEMAPSSQFRRSSDVSVPTLRSEGLPCAGRDAGVAGESDNVRPTTWDDDRPTLSARASLRGWFARCSNRSTSVHEQMPPVGPDAPLASHATSIARATSGPYCCDRLAQRHASCLHSVSLTLESRRNIR
jgi:hypothetical protein